MTKHLIPAILATLFVVACSKAPEPAKDAAPAATPQAAGNPAAGKTLAEAKCVSCHGLDGKATGPDIPHLAGQKADGCDQLSALKGGQSPRTHVFCHFPHGDAPRDAVMDGFYAGSYVREGDLKLIRFYARADDGSDELELYDLAKDPGERHNLAREKPEVAAKLNDLLQRYLVDNEAVIPKLNPDFGKAAPVTKAAPKKAAAPDDLPGGWKNRAGAAAVRDGALHVQSKGANSFLGVAAGLTAGTARFSFRVRAPQAGEGKVALLGAAGTTETLSVPYKVSGESVWETVTLELPVKEKAGILRLYLPAGSATVDFDDIVLTTQQGKPRRWTF